MFDLVTLLKYTQSD